MKRSLLAPRVITLALAASAALGTWAITDATSSQGAGCQLGAACTAQVGLLVQYTHNPSCGGNPIDPINTLWFTQTGAYPASATPTNVEQDFNQMKSLKLGDWTYDDENYSILNINASDPQAVKEFTISTDPYSRAVYCHSPQDGDRATGYFYASNRYHVRLFETKPESGITYVAGDAHHDYASSNCPEIHVGPIGFHKHESIGFNDSRNTIYGMWVKGHYREHFDYWGNTRGIKNCDGNYIRSDGYVAALETFQGLPG